MVFLGTNGVGKTSIIKLLKGNNNMNKLGHTQKIKYETPVIREN